MKIRLGGSFFCFLCLGIKNKDIIKKLFKKENPKKDREGYYKTQGYGRVYGKNLQFIGTSGVIEENDQFYHAGLTDKQTREILENHTVKEAKKKFQKLLKDKFNISISENQIDLFYGKCYDDDSKYR